MITNGFSDATLLQFKLERECKLQEQLEQKEKVDITKGYAYINGERITFTPFPLLDTNFVVMIPDEFLRDRPPIIKEQRITIINRDASICLFFDVSVQPAEETFTHAASWESVENDPQSYYRLDFEYSQIKGLLICAKYRFNDWQEIIHQIMYSVVETQEGKDEN